jgi:molybdate transport system substrate-binding protein
MRARSRPAPLAVVLLVAPLLAAPLAACRAASPAPSGRTVTVLAAASLTEVFTDLGHNFEAGHPGTVVRFSFAASSALAQQVTAGAPADVFASAGPGPMEQVVQAADAVGEPAVFARNQLVIAVPKGNPRGVARLADLARPGLKVALCAAQVPCGAAARTALAAGRVTVTPVTLEPDVRATLTKLRLGEVDAALVYRTDVRAVAADVDGVEFPESDRAVNDYPIAVLAGAPNPAGAREFVAFVRSPAALTTLTAAGFQAP